MCLKLSAVPTDKLDRTEIPEIWRQGMDCSRVQLQCTTSEAIAHIIFSGVLQSKSLVLIHKVKYTPWSWDGSLPGFIFKSGTENILWLGDLTLYLRSQEKLNGYT